MHKSILIVSTNFPPAANIGVQRVTKICKYLNHQWRIHVLTLKEKYNAANHEEGDARIFHKNLVVWRTHKFDVYSFLIRLKDRLVNHGNSSLPTGDMHEKKTKSPGKRRPVKFLRSKLGILTDILEFPDKDIAWVPFAVFEGYRIVRKNDIDLIFASGPKHSNLMAAQFLKLLTGKKLIIDFRDPWARSPWLVDRRKSSPVEKLKHRLVAHLEKRIVVRADQVLFITQALRDEFVEYYHWLPPDKFKVFYNGYDPQSIYPASSRVNKIVVERKPIIFSHIGSLYKKRNPENLIYAINELIENNQLERGSVVFIFVGNIGKDLKHIEPLVKNLGLEDVVRFVPPVSYSESYNYMASSDILLILQPDAKLMLPGKFFDYLYFDKSMLAIGKKGGEVDKIISGKYGVFVDNDDRNEIKTGILNIIRDRATYADSIRKHKHVFDMSRSITTLDSILKHL